MNNTDFEWIILIIGLAVVIEEPIAFIFNAIINERMEKELKK